MDFSDCVVVGVDNLPGAVPIETFEWPKEHVVMAFGQEQTGLTQEVIDLCQHMVYISQYGSVRSLNVGVASGIAMYDYCCKMVRPSSAQPPVLLHPETSPSD